MRFSVQSGLTVAALAGALALSGAAHAKPTGAAVFQQQCAMCHAIAPTPGKMGPPLGGVVGRKRAGAAGYAYSDALKRLGGRWTQESLERFLASPSAMAPGTRMPVSVPDEETRDALVRYLAHESATREARGAAQARAGR